MCDGNGEYKNIKKLLLSFTVLCSPSADVDGR